MKQLRIIIIAFILLSVGAFIWITAGNGADKLLFERLEVTDRHHVSLVLLISAFILLSTLSGLPVFYLSMALGFLLTFLPAMLIGLVVNAAAVMATFYMVRYAFSNYFREKYGKKKLIRRINKRIRKYGLWTVVFSRGVYIFPTSLINFSFPLSNISTRSYLAGTLIGLIPESLVNVLTGYLVKHQVILLTAPEARTWKAVVIGGFLLVFTLAFLLLRIRQQRRNRRLKLDMIPYDSP